MRKIRNIFLKTVAFAAAAFMLAAAVSCSGAESGAAEQEMSETETPDAEYTPAPSPAFGSAEEAEEMIYALRRTNFETGVYDRKAVLAFEDACVDAVQYLRHNKEDEDYLQNCYALYAAMISARDAVEYRKGDVPRVYITTYGGVAEDRYSKCTVSFVDKVNGTLDPVKDTAAQIKIRGNSTAGADKKPYNIKLSSDQNVFGMESGSKWALLANHFDKTLIRNKLSLDFAAAAGVTAALDSRFAEVYLNGKLLGSYLVCEPVTDGKHRADIDVSAGEFMVERVKAWASPAENSVTTSRLKLRFDIEYYGGDPVAVEDVLNKAERAIISGDESRIREYIDVDSFVSMYIVHEYLKDCDMTYGSSYLCYKNGVLWCGPLWDMDLSAGNVSVYHDEDKYRIYNNLPPFGDGSGDSASGIWARQDWFAYLCECPFFMELAKEKYASLTPYIESLYAENGYIDSLAAEYGASFGRNYTDAGWDIRAHASPYESQTDYRTYEQALAELKSWLERRHEYLKKAFE